MFHYIEGIVDSLAPNLAVVDCGGMGFALSVSNNTLSSLNPGERARLYTYLYLREDAMELFGFFDRQEKACFEKLIGVSGVGPKAALAVLSYNTPAALAFAVAAGNEKALTVAPGVGKRIAQRVILELKDKISKEMGSSDYQPASGVGGGFAGAGEGSISDAMTALSVLGYSSAEVAPVLKKLDVKGMTAEEIIKAVLKHMVK